MSQFILIVGMIAICASHLAHAEPESRIKIYPQEHPKICEDFIKSLNSSSSDAPLPVCKVFPARLPDATPVPWESLDVLRNIELLYKLEQQLRTQLTPEPESDFNAWLKQFRIRAANPSTLPTVKQAKIALTPTQSIQFIYSYETAEPRCSPTKLARWEGSKNFGPFILFHHTYAPENEWYVGTGFPFMHKNHFNLLSTYLSNKSHYWEWSARIVTYKPESRSFLKPGDGYDLNWVCQLSDTLHFQPPPKQ